MDRKKFEELVESWTCGNRNYVRKKFKYMKTKSKLIFLQIMDEAGQRENFENSLIFN